MIKATLTDKDLTSTFIRKFNNNIEQALILVGELVVVEAKSNSPVDTGYLRSRNQYSVDGKTVLVYNDALYAGPVELGTRRAGSQPFLTPAVEENVDKIKNTIRITLGR